jgi:hydrogenase maturation protease
MIAVIGCGNPARRDDGAASEVLRRLAPLASDGTKLLDAGTDGVAVMFAARGCWRLFIVDACRTGAEPGAVFEVPGDALEPAHAPPLAAHDFRWDHAIATGRRIYRDDFPSEVTVFLIEAESLDFGVGLSTPVAASAEIVADRIAGLLG